jgi:hypothetical protein
MTYKVMVDDNYDYMDEEKRYTHGEFETLEAAIEACKRIVNEWLQSNHKPGMSADELYTGYKTYGVDPWISGDENKPFSAWKYAEERCVEICSKG